MGNIMDYIKVILMVQLFYSVIITMMVYALPADVAPWIQKHSDVTDEINLQTVSEDVDASLQNQLDIPLIELGALVFYSGNILIDLLLNFAFAIPQMLGLLVSGILTLLNVDTVIWASVQLFMMVLVTVIYVISLIQLVLGLRSGTGRMI